MTMQLIKTLFKTTSHLENRVYNESVNSCYENQNQTKDAFSEKSKFWNKLSLGTNLFWQILIGIHLAMLPS